jgi:hypothetical protein
MDRYGQPDIFNTDQGVQGGFKRSSQHDPLLVYRSTPVTDPTGSQLSVMLWCGGPTWKG